MPRFDGASRPIARALLFSLIVCAPALAYAQTGGLYDLTWSTIDGGGGTFSTGGIYSLGGTAGQPDAGLLVGGQYILQGGFWYGGVSVVGVGDEPPAVAEGVPASSRLYRAVPNPFNPQTQIAFDLAHPANVRLAVYDLRGMLVRLIEERSLPAGHYVRTWDGTDDTGASVASGAYVFTIDAGDFHADQKGLLLK